MIACFSSGIDKFIHWPLSLRCFFMGFLGLIFFSLGYGLVLKPKFEQNQRLKEKEKILKDQFEGMHQQSMRVKVYKKQIKHLKQDLRRRLKSLSPPKDLANLVEDL